MRRMQQAAAGLAVGLLALGGCGPGGPKTYRVYGKATFDGKPIPQGIVHFSPHGPGVAGFADIVDGQFDTAKPGGGAGVVGGPHSIRLSGFTGIPGPEAPRGQALFNEHTENRTLPTEDSEQNFEVKKKK